jgi:putative endonuclease
VLSRFRRTDVRHRSADRTRRPARSTRSTGSAAERRVRKHFLLRGYRILAANEWVGGNELDLVVRRGRRLVFCEVKTKEGDAYGDPWEMVTEEKAHRVRRAAESWLATRPELRELEVTLEAIAVRSRRVERVSMT